jgi:hypothetical protein
VKGSLLLRYSRLDTSGATDEIMLVDDPASLKDRNVYRFRFSRAPDDEALRAPENDCGYGLR